MIYDDNRPERIRGTIYLSVLLLVCGYMAVNAFVPNADMIVATRVLAAGFYGVVLYVYGGDFWRSLSKPEPARSDFLIVGIWLSFLGHELHDLYALVFRLADAPKWLLNAEIVSPIVMLSAVAAVLHIAAPGAIDGTVPRKNRIALGVGVGLAVVGVVAVLSTRPNLGPIIERARPYIGDWFAVGPQSGQPPPSGPG